MADDIAPSELEDWKERWKNRRRMAWAAFIGINIAATYLFLKVPGSTDTTIAWYFGTMATIIAGYMGTTAYAYTKAT